MEIPQKILTLRGPNVWGVFPVFEAWVDVSNASPIPVALVDSVVEQLKSWIPGRLESTVDVAARETTEAIPDDYLPRMLAQIALALQSLCGSFADFFRVTQSTSSPNLYKVSIAYVDDRLGRKCLEAASEVVLAALRGQTTDLQATLESLREFAAKTRPSVGLAALLEALRERDVPALRLNDGEVYQLGYGAKQRRINGLRTDRTSSVAECLCSDADALYRQLHSAGVPPWDHDKGQAPGERFELLVVDGKVIAAAHVQTTGTTRTATDVFSILHPEVAQRAVAAVHNVGLDIAGVVLAAPDVTRSLEESAGVVVAVQANPDCSVHTKPVCQNPRPLGKEIANYLFPANQNGRIPIVAITGTNGKTTTTRLIAHILTRNNMTVGMTCTDGIYIGSRRFESGDCSGPRSARAVLLNRSVDAAVLETARGGILREGLAFDRCDVAVVTNIADGDHLGLNDIHTVEQLARVKRTIVDAVAPTGAAVLKADDPLTEAMAPHCPGSVVFFCRDGNHRVIQQRRQQRGRVVFVRDNSVILADGDSEFSLLSLDRVPLTQGGKISFQVENVLAATAATWALGVPCENILAALETFGTDLGASPGRFNLLEIKGAFVVFDYGHNPASLVAMLETLSQFPAGRRTAVYSAAGDRRDVDMIRQGQLLGDAFDRVIIYEDQYVRGREKGQIIALFKQGVQAGKSVSRTEDFLGWQPAVEATLETVQPGEVVLVQADDVDTTVEFLREYLLTHPGRELGLQEALKLARGETIESTAAIPAPKGSV